MWVDEGVDPVFRASASIGRLPVSMATICFLWIGASSEALSVAIASARLINAGFRELPVVECGELVWTGFRPDRLQEARRAKQ